MVLMAIFAYKIAPDNTSNANQMHLSIHSKPPGFKVKVLVLKSNYYPSNKSSFFSGEINKTLEIPIQDYKIRSDGAEIQPYGSPTDYFEFIEVSKLQSPLTESSFEKQHLKEKKFLLGTDKYGRDMLSRLIIGSRISLSVGFIAVFISLLIGIFLGALAGFYGGYLDKGIVWLINVFWSIPTLLIVIAITLALGRGFWQVFIAVGLTMWVEVARVVRGQVLSLKREDFCKGCSNTRIWTNKNHKASYSSNAYSSFNRHISCQFCKCNFDRKWTELFGDWHSTPCTELGGDGKRSFQVFAIGKTLFDIIARTGHNEFGFGIYDTR